MEVDADVGGVAEAEQLEVALAVNVRFPFDFRKQSTRAVVRLTGAISKEMSGPVKVVPYRRVTDS
ncbi:MAG TPA: hypothetical protein VFH48_40010 [Chloroflexota bacterium]|nr:hypothetical protein [Chloroflexota bacterium]